MNKRKALTKKIYFLYEYKYILQFEKQIGVAIKKTQAFLQRSIYVK